MSRRIGPLTDTVRLLTFASGGVLRAEAFELRANERVALARGGFETLAIEHRHMSVPIRNESRVLERARDGGDRRPACPEHDGEKFVAQLKILPVHPVLRHQQPARAALLY